MPDYLYINSLAKTKFSQTDRGNFQTSWEFFDNISDDTDKTCQMPDFFINSLSEAKFSETEYRV